VSRLRALLDALLADVGRNPTWYAIVGYVVVSTAQVGIRAGLAERARTREIIETTRRGLAERAEAVEDRMRYAVEGEHTAKYDAPSWGEIEARPASKDET
jgi:hypothetical protein